MSVENVRLFYETIAKDRNFRSKILDASKEYSLASVNDDELEKLMAEEFLPLLKEEGFDFTLSELTEYQRQLNSNLDKKLNEKDYRLVSGGVRYHDAIRDFLEKIHM